MDAKIAPLGMLAQSGYFDVQIGLFFTSGHCTRAREDPDDREAKNHEHKAKVNKLHTENCDPASQHGAAASAVEHVW